MDNRTQHSLSLYAKLIACLVLTNFIMIVFSSFYVYEAWQERQIAVQIAEMGRGTESFSLVFRDLSFERGRTNVMLSNPLANTAANRIFIAERRALVDENFANGMAWLVARKSPQELPLQMRYATFLTARGKVKQALKETVIKSDPQLNREWMDASNDLADQIILVLDLLGKKQQISGLFSIYHQLIVDALEFRNLIGKSATLITAAIARQAPFQAEEYRRYLELQAQADYLWDKISTEISASDSERLRSIQSSVQQLYYKTYREEQDRLLAQVLSGTVPPERLPHIQSMSVFAFDSVFSLIDQIKQEIFADMKNRQDMTQNKLMNVLLYFYILLAMMSFTLLYFDTRLFQPLRAITAALGSIRQGEPVPLLDRETLRTDEIGQLATGAMLLQLSMEEERRLMALNEYLASTDSLTGCLNKRSFYQRAEMELCRAGRENKVVVFALFDLDNMKQVNDRFGHLVGDTLLQHLVRLISKLCRPYDLLGRFGGDEFMLFMITADASSAELLCQRIFDAIQQQPLLLQQLPEPLPLTISMGVSYGAVQDETPLLWYLEQADKTLYEAKQHGKNRIVFRPTRATPSCGE